MRMNVIRRNHGCRLSTEGTHAGLRTVVLENKAVRVTVLADQGSDVFEFLHKPTDTDFMWANPCGLPHPARKVFGPDLRTAFTDFYHGGWQELFPHGSAWTEVHGTTIPTHGEVWGAPWDVEVVRDTVEEVAVKFTVRTRKMPFTLEKTLSLRGDAPVLRLDETVANESPVDLDFMWGHHPAFGAPFLSEDCVLLAPAKEVLVNQKFRTSYPIGEVDGKKVDFSRMPAPGSGVHRMLYFTGLKQGWYALVNRRTGVGFGMGFDPKVFPIVWIWQCAETKGGAPFFGRAYAVAVEPFSSLPKAREDGGRLLKLAAGKKLRTRLTACAITGAEEATGITAEGKVLARKR